MPPAAARFELPVPRSTVNLRQLEAWSSQYGWVERARAWDDEKDWASRPSELDAIAEMRERHVKAARLLHGKGLIVLSKATYVSARTALDMISRGVELERLVRGEIEDAPTNDAGDLSLVRAAIADPSLAPLLVELQQLGIEVGGDSDDGEGAPAVCIGSVV